MSEDINAVKDQVTEPLEVTPPAPATDDDWLAEPEEDKGIELDPEDVPADEPEVETPDEPESEEDEQSGDDDPDAPKTEKAKNRFQQLANENNVLTMENRTLREKVRELARAQYPVQTAEEIMEASDEVIDEDKAELLSLKQRVEASDFTNHVVELTANINSDANNVLREFPEFDPKSDDYDEEFATQTREGYFKRARVEFDETGQYVISADEPLYEYYKEMADIRRKALNAGQAKSTKAKADMLSRVDARPAGKPAPTKSSEDDDAFLKGFNSV